MTLPRSQPDSAHGFEDWKKQYRNRVKLMAGVKTYAASAEMVPADEILKEQWEANENPNDAADAEMTDWDE